MPILFASVFMPNLQSSPSSPAVHVCRLQAQVILTLYTVALLAELDVGHHFHLR